MQTVERDSHHKLDAHGYTDLMTSTAEIPAVAADDVAEFLRRFGLLDEFESGQLTCSVCGSALVDAGLAAARLREHEIVFACEKLDCLEEFHRPSA